MSVQELRAECQARGLGTARSRAELVQRLAGNDNEHGQPQGGVVQDTAASATDMVAARLSGPESVLSARFFLLEFPAEPGGPDEETHLAYRQATIQGALDAGLVPRGDARRAATRDGMWVYEVSVRRVT